MHVRRLHIPIRTSSKHFPNTTSDKYRNLYRFLTNVVYQGITIHLKGTAMLPMPLEGLPKFGRPRPVFYIHAPRRPNNAHGHQQGTTKGAAGSLCDGFLHLVMSFWRVFSFLWCRLGFVFRLVWNNSQPFRVMTIRHFPDPTFFPDTFPIRQFDTFPHLHIRRLHIPIRASSKHFPNTTSDKYRNLYRILTNVV